MIDGDQHHITFDTDLMVGMSISFLEHDLHHDLHPGYKAEDRASQALSGMTPDNRQQLSGDMSSGPINYGTFEGNMEMGGGTYIQKGGLIPGVTQGEENEISNRVQQMNKLFSTYTTQIDSIKSDIKGIEEYLDPRNLDPKDLEAMEPVFAQIDQRNKQIEELKKELQFQIVNQVTLQVPNRWIRIKILLVFSERYSKEYNILLGNIFDENTFNEITTEILLHQIVDELNPSDSQQIPRPRGRQQLYITQMTRSGMGYFVYILYNCDEDSVIFLNNEIIDSTSYQKTNYQNTNPPQIHYSFHSNLLGLDLVLKVYLPELCTPTSTLHLQLQLPDGVSVDFMNPSVKWLFEDESRYNILQEHQTIFCNYLVHVQNSQDRVYNEQKSYLGMSGGIGGKTSSFSLNKEASSSIFNYIVALNVILGQLSKNKRASKQRTNEMIPVSIAESLGEENELCYHNFASCINPTLMHSLFPEASQLEGFPIENIFIGQLLNTDNFVPWFPDNNIPLVDDNTNINKTSQFCNFIGKIVSVLQNYLSAGDGEQVKISLQQLLTLFQTVTPREKEMIFENGNQNFNQEVKIGYMLNVLQLVVILYYYLYQDNKYEMVRTYLENTMLFTHDNIRKLFEYMHTIFNNFYTTYCGYITEILGSKKTLTGQQKLNITFFVCIASASFRYSLNRLLNSDQTGRIKESVFQKEFIKKNYDMMAKTIDPEQISKMTPGGNIDDLTWTNIIKFISSGTTRFEGNSNYLLKKGIKNNSNFLQELVNSEETSEALKKYCFTV
jgi:hypothetical protein